MNRTNRAITPGFVLIQPNMTSVNTLLLKNVLRADRKIIGLQIQPMIIKPRRGQGI